MALNKFQKQIENMKTNEILGSNYICKKCSTNKVDITMQLKNKKTHKTKKNKLLLMNKILLVLVMVILIFTFTFNNNVINYFKYDTINEKINSIKVYILSKINLH